MTVAEAFSAAEPAEAAHQRQIEFDREGRARRRELGYLGSDYRLYATFGLDRGTHRLVRRAGNTAHGPRQVDLLRLFMRRDGG